MTTLFPPILESQRESIWFYGDPKDHSFPIRFQMPAVNVRTNEIRHIQVSIKYKTRNVSAINSAFTPDAATLFFSLGPNAGKGLPPTDKNAGWTYDGETQMCSIDVPYLFFDGGAPKNGCEYTIQIRFGDNFLWDEAAGNLARIGWHTGNYSGFSQWFNASTSAVPSSFGEWSNVQKMYCIQRAGCKLTVDTKDSFCPTVRWEYQPSQGENGEVLDGIEQIILQWDWSIGDGLGGEDRQYRTQTFNGQFNGSDIFTFTQLVPIAPIVPIHFAVTAITQHNTIYVLNAILNPYDANGNVMIFNQELAKCRFGNLELKDAQTDDGCLAKQVYIEKGHDKDSLQFFRYDLKTLDCVLIKEVTIKTKTTVRDVSAIYTMKDYTVSMGEEYQYIPIIVEKNPVNKDFPVRLCAPLQESGKGTAGYGRLMSMEITFLNDRYRQLRIPGNLQVSSFRRNTSDTFQTTIGGKYPFYIRSGAQNYRTLQVSAVVSINFDPTFTFLQLDDAYGLIWEDEKSRTLLVDRKDIFGSSDFSNSRWRVGHPGGSKLENPKIEALGNDAFDRWALLDAKLNHAEIKIDNVLKNTDQSKSRAERIKEYMASATTDQRDFLLQLLTEEMNLQDEMNSYYTNRAYEFLDNYPSSKDITKEMLTEWKRAQAPNGNVISQQNLASYAGKTVYNANLIRNNTTTIGTDHTDETVYVERKFRDAVMSWLSDGKPKLYRSETEGNMIVIVSQPSFMPLNKTQRMVYSVSMTLTEIADFTLQNLIEYNLIPSQIISEHIPRGEWEISFGNPDPWVKAMIGLNYSPEYDIPTIKIEDVIADTKIDDIDMNPAKVNAYYPDFLWIATGLPEGFTLDPKTGILHCDKTKLKTTRRGTALIEIYDRWVFDDLFDAMWSYRDLPTPSPLKPEADWTEDERHKMEYLDWWNEEMKNRHDHAEMVINTGEIYHKFIIGWKLKQDDALNTSDPVRISVQAAGTPIDPVYFSVYSEAPGKPPYSWGVSNNLPLGLGIQISGDDSEYCELTGQFRDELSVGGEFYITCTDSKYQVVSIPVTYERIHQPVQLREKAETKVLTDWEETYDIIPVNYSKQRYYGIGPFKYQLVFGGTGQSTIPGVDINEDTGVLSGIPTGWSGGYPYQPNDFTVRVYDLGDECAPDNLPDRAVYKDGKTYRIAELTISVTEILRKFEFIKPWDIDVVEQFGDEVEVGFTFTNPYMIMQKRVKEDGTEDASPDALPPVRGGRSRTRDPIPYEFYARSKAGDGILQNFSVGSNGRFTSTCVQTSKRGILEIVAVDGRGHEVSIEVGIPRVNGPLKIIPVPSDKFVIPLTYINNPDDVNKEWFRVYCDKTDPPSPTDAAGQANFKDDVRGEKGNFENFKISVEGVPAGIRIKMVSDANPPYFSFYGAPVGTTGKKELSQLESDAEYVETIDWDQYAKDPGYRSNINGELNKRGISLGAGTHLASMTIKDNFTVNVNGVPQDRPRAAAASILIEGVAPPFIWEGNVKAIEARDTNQCEEIAPVPLPRVTGGKGPYRWKLSSLEALKPYTVIPMSTDSQGGFDDTDALYIVGKPTQAMPERDVDLTIVDANGFEQTITVHVGEIFGTFGAVPGDAWQEDFIINISNASNGQIRVAFPEDNGADYEFIYRNGDTNNELPNGMILSKDGFLTGVATKECLMQDIGKNIIIKDTRTGRTIQCPTWILPATVPSPVVNPDLTLTGGKLVIDGLIQNKPYASPPLFVWKGTQTASTVLSAGGPIPPGLNINQTTFMLVGNLTYSTNADINATFTCAVGGRNLVTPRAEASISVVFKPISTIFTLTSPQGDFRIPGLTVGEAMDSIVITEYLILSGGTEPITWNIKGHEGYGLTFTPSAQGRKLTLSGTPTKRSDSPIEVILSAKDSKGQVTTECTMIIPGIFTKLSCTPTSITIPARTAGQDITDIKLTASGGSGDAKNFSWSDVTGLLSDYGYTIKDVQVTGTSGTATIGGTAATYNMPAYNGTERYLELKDTRTQQVVKIRVSIGAITGGDVNIYPREVELPTKIQGQTVNFPLENYIIGSVSGAQFTVDPNNPIPNDWNTISLQGSKIVGKVPNKVINQKKSFSVRVTKSDGTSIGGIKIILPIVAV